MNLLKQKVELSHFVGPLFLGLALWGMYTPDKMPMQILFLLGLWITYHTLFLRGRLEKIKAQQARELAGGG